MAVSPEQSQKEACEWITKVSGSKPEGGQSAHEWLKSGVVLCNMLNTIKAGTVKKVNTLNSPFKMMENVSAFIQGCRALGVNEKDVFSTPDLYDGKNMATVFKCIYCLGCSVQVTVPEFKGPTLGDKKLARTLGEKKRDFGLVTQSSGFSTSMDKVAIEANRSAAFSASNKKVG